MISFFFLIFIYFWLCQVLVAACVRDLSLWHAGYFIAACRLLSGCGVQAPECMGSVVVGVMISYEENQKPNTVSAVDFDGIPYLCKPGAGLSAHREIMQTKFLFSRSSQSKGGGSQ